MPMENLENFHSPLMGEFSWELSMKNSTKIHETVPMIMLGKAMKSFQRFCIEFSKVAIVYHGLFMHCFGNIHTENSLVHGQ